MPATLSAKDDWVQVKSKNFLLIGNASEKDIRKVGTKLEQFREAFRLIFSSSNLTASIPTNVVVFKSSSSYKQFKPKRADGKIDEQIAGYFQPGDDVNYITLAVGGDPSETYGTIFHEYVHFIINTNFGRSAVPQWFNEGLAEYYQTFEIADDIKVKLGLPQNNHLALLQQSKLMPLDQLLRVTNYQLHQTGGHSRSIFYAQSWALVHFLTQGGRSAALTQYLNAVVKGVDEKAAFEDAFQTTYAKMEKDLRNYVSKSTYQYNEVKFKFKLEFETGMQVSPLDEAESNAYLGDLLYHNNRPDDAEPFLNTALKLRPDLGMATTALGMVKIKQRKFDEARTLLERAIAGDPKNHIAYYQYAFLLSRAGRDEFGFVQAFDAELATRMRDSLKKAIAIDPTFAESYELMVLIALVNNDGLDEAAKYLQTALKYQPGNQRYLLRSAELLVRQSKFDEALQLAEKIEANAEDDETRSRAGAVLSQIRQRVEFEKTIADANKRNEAIVSSANGKPRLTVRPGAVLSEAEVKRREEEAVIRTINGALRMPEVGEKRVLGSIEKIDCKKRPLVYSIKAGNESFSVTSIDFEGIALTVFDASMGDVAVGCGSDLSTHTALLTYKEDIASKAPARGQLVALEFVPSNFRLMTEDEITAASQIVYQPSDSDRPPAVAGAPNMPDQGDMDAMRRKAMMDMVNTNLTKPGPGEKREMGYLDKIECTNKTAFFHLRLPNQTIKLRQANPASPPKIVIFAPDLAGLQFGCGIKPIEYPVVVTFADNPDKKSKSTGDILTLEFVPKSFVLDQ
ncbi:MAG: tetratricopeptide repeat protein [Pyrinomonadaceae bacterium]